MNCNLKKRLIICGLAFTAVVGTSNVSYATEALPAAVEITVPAEDAVSLDESASVQVEESTSEEVEIAISESTTNEGDVEDEVTSSVELLEEISIDTSAVLTGTETAIQAPAESATDLSATLETEANAAAVSTNAVSTEASMPATLSATPVTTSIEATAAPAATATAVQAKAKAVAVKNGLVVENGKKHYYDNGKMYANRWRTVDGKTYYFGPNGDPVTGYFVHPTSGAFHYFDTDGAQFKNRWKTISGTTYYFNANGIAQTGLMKLANGAFHYFDPTTRAQYKNRWKTVSGTTYYFNANGIAYSGLLKMNNGALHFFDPTTKAQYKNRWKTVGSNTYYFNVNGIAATGLTEGPSGDMHYFDPATHAQLKNSSVEIDGITHTFNANGVRTSAVDKAAAEEAETRTASPNTVPDFQVPTKGYISSYYGPRWGSFHYGIDFAAPTGTPIYASAGGVVTARGYSGSYGYRIIVDHGNGYATLYAHLSSMNVSIGQNVTTSTMIGRVGSTGNSTGPHLHFEVRVKGAKVNPYPFLY